MHPSFCGGSLYPPTACRFTTTTCVVHHYHVKRGLYRHTPAPTPDCILIPHFTMRCLYWLSSTPCHFAFACLAFYPDYLLPTRTPAFVLTHLTVLLVPLSQVGLYRADATTLHTGRCTTRVTCLDYLPRWITVPTVAVPRARLRSHRSLTLPLYAAATSSSRWIRMPDTTPRLLHPIPFLPTAPATLFPFLPLRGGPPPSLHRLNDIDWGGRGCWVPATTCPTRPDSPTTEPHSSRSACPTPPDPDGCFTLPFCWECDRCPSRSP